MEKQVDKIIADKINSLTDLPEGYSPNLEAKWAMLSGEKKSEETFFTLLQNNWQKVAAIVLFLLLSTVIWLNVTTTITITVEQQDSNSKKEDQLKPQLVQRISPEESVIHKSHLRKNTGSVSPISEEKKKDELKPQEITNQEIRIQEVTPVLPLISQDIPKTTEIIKVKKARYVQIDFEDSSKAQQNHDVYAQSVRFKLGINFNSTNKEDDHSGHGIKISSNF